MNLYYFGSLQSLFYANLAWGLRTGPSEPELPPPHQIMAYCLTLFQSGGANYARSKLCPPHYYLPPARIFRPSYGPGDDHAQPLIGDGFVREQRIVRKFEFMNIEYMNVERTVTLCNLRK